MNTTNRPPVDAEGGPTAIKSSKRPSRRTQILLSGAAVLAVVAIAGALLLPGSTPSAAAAAVGNAARNTAQVTDFRMTLVADDSAIVPGGRAVGEVDGENMHLSSGDLDFYRVGDREWIGEGGVFESAPAADDFAPFGAASEAVVTAALESNEVGDEGTELLDGVETTHYVIVVDDDARAALSAVPSSAQFWFVGNVSEEIVEDGSEVQARRFGFLEDAASIDVWVADGLIHQISVDSGSSRFTYSFHDFNEDITVTAPE